MTISLAIRALLSVFCIVLGACSSKADQQGSDESSGGAAGEIDSCCRLGAICHVVADDVDPEIEACHHLGHENVQEACDARYEECLALCEGLNDEPMEHACD